MLRNRLRNPGEAGEDGDCHGPDKSGLAMT
jgi:hypothetical protein